MRGRKFKKSVNKIDELPSFLLNVKSVPEDIDIPPKPKKSVSYLGPIFIGECPKCHPPHRSVRLSDFHHVQIFKPSKENMLKDVFLPRAVDERKHFESKTFTPAIRHQKVFADPFLHKCPGVRKVFGPDISLSEGLGETKSIIEGEMSREIPFCRLKKFSTECDAEKTKTEVEIVTLSDIREEKRKFMSHTERMAHAHYPKEFVTVRVIGPTIPEALTITKLPSKRQTSFEIDLHLKSKEEEAPNKELEKDEESAKEEVAGKEKSKESVESHLTKEESSVEEGTGSENIRQQSEELDERSGPEKSQIIRDAEEDEVGEGEEEGEREEVSGEGGEEEEAREGVEEKEDLQTFADEEKEGSLGDVEAENLQEAAED